MVETLKELKSMSDEELFKVYDEVAKQTGKSTSFYITEINRRDQEKQTSIMIKCTKWITFMTFIMMIFTILSTIYVLTK
ncbi:MAG: hypothetical protein ABII64_02295 [Elusimicrobiota bacterium]